MAKLKKITDDQWKIYIDLARVAGLSPQYSALDSQKRFMCDIIANLPKGSLVVEVGVCTGQTSAMFVQCNEIEFIGVDNWSLYSSEEEVREKLGKFNRQFTLVNHDSSTAPWDGRLIDFLFIDGGHQEDVVKPDCETWIPRVKPGGYVSFHDWDGSEDPSVTPHWAVTHYGKMHTEGWKEIGFIDDQMMVKQKPL